MANETKRGLERVDDIYERRHAIGKELAQTGREVIGYLCYFAPPELITAAGMIPYRILGRMGDDITESDNYVEPLGCPYIRNCFEQDLKGRQDFLTGRIIPHSCDSAQRIYGIWKTYKPSAYNYLFSVPHMTTPWSVDFFRRELVLFKESLEKHTGRPISNEQIEDTVRLYNDNRALVGELYALRKTPHPALTAARMFKLLVAGMIIQPEEFNTLLKEVKEEVEQRPGTDATLPRILFWGCIIDDAKFYELIEGAGAHIVTDDTCIGTRSYLRSVDTSGGIMEGLTRAYFEEFKCPRTDLGPGLGRFDYVLDLIEEYG
ncbi:MAG: 2-hydroxyacyl-CoA dehydratase, partial [Deltaproteobacteria bacterium]|nr:2-hydroxyacyl-CoA dehydratase [Deltaproteobacteria bacterium]